MINIAKLFSQDAHIPLNKHLARTIGTNEAILLGELIRQRERFGQPEFYIGQEILAYETTLSVDQIKSSGKNLKELGLILVVKKGHPARNYYQIDDEKIASYFDDSVSGKSTVQGVENPPTSQRKIHRLVRGKSTHIYLLNKKYNKKDNKGRILLFPDEEINDLIYEFIEDRKERKKPVTDRGIHQLVEKLKRLSNEKDMQEKIINQAIEKGYQSFYPYKNDEINNGGASGSKKTEPTNTFQNGGVIGEETTAQRMARQQLNPVVHQDGSG